MFTFLYLKGDFYGEVFVSFEILNILFFIHSSYVY